MLSASKRSTREMDQYAETNATITWYLQASTYLFAAVHALQESLKKIPKFLYKDNPGHQSHSSMLDFSKWSSALSWLSPLLLISSWINTYQAAKKFFTAENRNLESYLNFAISIITSMTWTVMSVAVMGGATYILSHIAPFLMVGLFAVNAAYGFINTAKNLYFAWTAKDKSERNKFLWLATKQLIFSVFGTVATVLSVFIGIDVSKTMASVAEGDLLGLGAAIRSVGGIFSKTTEVMYGIVVTALAGVAVSVISSFAKIKDAFKSKIASPSPVQQLPEPVSPERIKSVQQHLKEKLAKLENECPNDKRKSKVAILQRTLSEKFIEVKEGNETVVKLNANISVDTIEREAKLSYKNVYGSMFRRVGQVKQCMEEVRELEVSQRMGG